MKKNIFGTDGIRCQVGSSPLSIKDLSNLGYAVGLWAQKKYGKNACIAIGCDTRQSCAFVKNSLVSGLLLNLINILDMQVLSTPALYNISSMNNHIDCCIMISASHNHYQDNGIKILGAPTGKISSIDEEEITSLFLNEHTISYQSFGNIESYSHGANDYLQILLSFFKKNFLYGKKIVLDCANGALFSLAPTACKILGADVIPINNKPNGININDQCGALYPDALKNAVIKYKADIGFAFDGDGDRVTAVNKYGKIKDGDDLLAVLIHHPSYKTTKTVVGTHMTNYGFEKFLQNKKINLIRTAVGDKFVSQQLTKRNLILGGEPSGHIIARDFMPSGDGLFIALRIMQALDYQNNWDMTTFDKYPQILTNIRINQKVRLDESPIASIINAHKNLIREGRLIVRYSGTEPLLRIMVEGIDLKNTQQVSNNLVKQLQQELS